MLGFEAVGQLPHRRRGALGLDVGQGIAAAVDLLLSRLASARAIVVGQSGQEPMVMRRSRPVFVR